MVDYPILAEFTLKDDVSRVLQSVIEKADRATQVFGDLQERLDKIGGGGINRLLRSLDRLETARFPGQLADGAERFDRLLAGADDKMAALVGHATELARVMRDLRTPSLPSVPTSNRSGRVSGGGHGGGGDPIMGGIEGGAVLEFFGGNYERFSAVDQVYKAMQGDKRLSGASPAMQALRDEAPGQLDRYRVLKPLDVAKNTAEAYAISGGNLEEQPGILNMLDRAEQNLVLRGTNPEDAQQQAKALVKALDIGNRFFDPKTGGYNQVRADAEMDRMQALIAVGGGFTSGQAVLSFEKSSKLAGQRLDLLGEAEMAHFVEIDPRNAGTRINSLENLFGGSAARMAKKDKAYWTSLGLYDSHGNLKDNDLLFTRPLEWVEKHMAHLSSQDIDNHTQRMNVSGIAQETTGAFANIGRQTQAVLNSDVNANAGNLLASPQGRTLLFEASLEKFRVALGKFEAGPGAMILDKLAMGLDKLTTIMSAHPEASENLLKLTAGIAALAVVRGVASLVGIGDGLGAIGKGLGLLGRGTAAGSALEAMTAAAGAGSLFTLAGGIVALGAALIALPPFLRYLFGDKDGSPHTATDARGHPHAASQDPTAPTYGTTPQQDMAKWLRDQWVASQHPTSHNAHGIAYRPDGGSGAATMLQPINFIVDGRTMARALIPHLMQAPTGPTDSLNFNPRVQPMRPGQNYAI